MQKTGTKNSHASVPLREDLAVKPDSPFKKYGSARRKEYVTERIRNVGSTNVSPNKVEKTKSDGDYLPLPRSNEQTEIVSSSTRPAAAIRRFRFRYTRKDY